MVSGRRGGVERARSDVGSARLGLGAAGCQWEEWRRWLGLAVKTEFPGDDWRIGELRS